MTRAQATEHYGLKYARWALDIQPDNARAQRVFLGIALEHLAMRTGGRPVAKDAPDLYAALATAPFVRAHHPIVIQRRSASCATIFWKWPPIAIPAIRLRPAPGRRRTRRSLVAGR